MLSIRLSDIASKTQDCSDMRSAFSASPGCRDNLNVPAVWVTASIRIQWRGNLSRFLFFRVFRRLMGWSSILESYTWSCKGLGRSWNVWGMSLSGAVYQMYCIYSCNRQCNSTVCIKAQEFKWGTLCPLCYSYGHVHQVTVVFENIFSLIKQAVKREGTCALTGNAALTQAATKLPFVAAACRGLWSRASRTFQVCGLEYSVKFWSRNGPHCGV
jgi:hypothetical protein